MKKGEIQNFSYTGKVQSITLTRGVYKLECWGAQGGTYSSYYGGYGGYSYGNLTITDDTVIYIYVGGQPASNSTSAGVTSGGFNGGGNGCGRNYSGTYTYGQGGGGGTDIRIGTDSLYARVIVAGGGGGSASVNANTTKYGGGTSGGSPTSGYAASQTGAGSGGSFGQGGAATTGGTNYKYGSGGGGGGWYGGGACTNYSDSTNYRGYNGGGSGYVYTSSTASSYPSGCLLNSSYYLTSAATIAGNQSIVSPTGAATTGNSGNGYIRITMLEGGDIPVWVKDDNQWKRGSSLYTKSNGKWMAVKDTLISTYINNDIKYEKKYVWDKRSIINDNNLSVLLNGDSIVDNSLTPHTITNGGGVTVSSSGKFGNALQFPSSTNGYLSINMPNLSQIMANDFTIDWWEYRTTAADHSTIMTFGSGQNYSLLLGYAYQGNILVYISSNGSSWDIAPHPTVIGTTITGTWVHRAMVRNSNKLLFFENGKLTLTIDNMTTFYIPSNIIRLCVCWSNVPLNGLIDDFRISTIARWTSNFDIPTIQCGTTVLGNVGYVTSKNVSDYPDGDYADDGYYYKRL